MDRAELRAELEAQLKPVHKGLEETNTRLSKVESRLFVGNGQPALTERVSVIERNQVECKDDHSSSSAKFKTLFDRNDRREAEHRSERARVTVALIAGVTAIGAALIGAFA